MDERERLAQEINRWQSEGGALAGGRPLPGRGTGGPSWPGARRLLAVGRKVGIAVAGGAVLVLGVALIVLPGPAIVVIPLGLAILATEFLWARRLLRRAREHVARLLARARRRARPAS